jgi:hypothetical protein
VDLGANEVGAVPVGPFLVSNFLSTSLLLFSNSQNSYLANSGARSGNTDAGFVDECGGAEDETSSSQ